MSQRYRFRSDKSKKQIQKLWRRFAESFPDKYLEIKKAAAVESDDGDASNYDAVITFFRKELGHNFSEQKRQKIAFDMRILIHGRYAG